MTVNVSVTGFMGEYMSEKNGLEGRLFDLSHRGDR
jgi:hypothetical protein